LATGAWEVDFSLQPCDVTADMWGAARVFDADGDASEVNPTPSPTMVIFPEWNWFDGNGWPTGIPVVISVAGKPACTTTADSERYFFNGGFPEGCDIVFGDVVNFTNGATTRTHTVQVLAVNRVDKPDDTVAGTATAGAEIHVWPHDGYEFMQPVMPHAHQPGVLTHQHQLFRVCIDAAKALRRKFQPRFLKSCPQSPLVTVFA